MSAVTCSTLHISLSSNKNYYIFTATDNGNSAAITGYTFNFGDHESYTVKFQGSSQNHQSASVTHTYEQAGVYEATASVDTNDGMKPVAVSSPACQASVTINPPASAMPNTGAGDAVGLFVAIVIVSLVGYQVKLRRTNA